MEDDLTYVDRELLRMFWLLSGTRSSGMGPNRLAVSEIIAGYQITWLSAPVCQFVFWVMALDEIWMNDYCKKEKARLARIQQK